MSTTDRDASSSVVLSIECLRGTTKADEWTADMLQTGDIVEELRIGSSMSMKSPFKNGRSKIQKILHASFKNKETSISVRVRRVEEGEAELQACIVPNDAAGRRQYMLRSIADPNYAVGFLDRTEADCLALQASRNSRMVNALSRYQLQDGYVSYPWEKKMQTFLSVPNSSGFLSVLFIPKASNKAASSYNDLDDTLARAHSWLNASQALGVPIVFMNIQTESMLTKISGETASSTVNAGSLSDLSNLANASLYGFEDYHGVDLGVVRAVRLWYAPLSAEFPVEIRLEEGDTKLGFAISRTEEGFIYISTVIDDDENAPSTRSGLLNLYREARSASKLLVISRVSNQKVLPWMVSSTGAVRCFDTVSLSQKLSLHRHAKVPILIHLFLWDIPLPQGSTGSAAHPVVTLPSPSPSPSPLSLPLPPEVQLARQPNDNQVQPFHGDLASDSGSEGGESAEFRLGRDTAGERSFSFHDFPLPNNWV